MRCAEVSAAPSQPSSMTMAIADGSPMATATQPEGDAEHDPAEQDDPR